MMQPLSFQDLLRLGKCHELLRPLQPAAVWHSGLEHVIMFIRPRAHFDQGAAAYRWLRSVAARGSDGRRSRQSPLHRLNPFHVGCKKLAPALASMNDKRMLHPLRAPDLKQLRLADKPSDSLVLWQNPNANLPGRYAYRKGENDRSLITSDNKTRPLNQASAVRSSFG